MGYLIDQWKECIDKGDIVGTLFTDFHKAFDVVVHSILLRKLRIYNLKARYLPYLNFYYLKMIYHCPFNSVNLTSMQMMQLFIRIIKIYIPLKAECNPISMPLSCGVPQTKCTFIIIKHPVLQ